VANIELRPETDADLPFLKDLYASSREREMALLTEWSDEQKREFLDQQFSAQRAYYRKHYPDARYDIIERDGQAIGRLYVAVLRREINLMDITLVPEERNAGLGTRLCKEVQDEGEREKKIVSLHVEDDNPARRLYDRLGFVEIAAVTFYKLMHWVPEGLDHLSAELAAEVRE
jgi:ribosomal protein S18 acetylase RimI-like enzyme